MTNLKEDLTDTLAHFRLTLEDVLWVYIMDANVEGRIIANEPPSDALLTRLEEEEFDPGHGFVFFCGTIWLKDGTWFDRDSYDGAEWWALRRRPKLPPKAAAAGGAVMARLYEILVIGLCIVGMPLALILAILFL